MADGELLDTPHGPARIHRRPAIAAPRATLVLGHGAGGSVEAPDLQAVTAAVTAGGIDVVLVEQPYRVAGRRSAAPAPKLDEAWLAVIEQLAPQAAAPIFVGGRSSGARVACRTAVAGKAGGVVCLAFPLITPKGASRQEELDHAGVPVLVIQGESDRFGMPEPGEQRQVVRVRGDHGLKRDLKVVAHAVMGWLDERLA
jgi:predicted alpha/beta-hydrolase family hydrolase